MKELTFRGMAALLVLVLLLPAASACDPNPIVPWTPTPAAVATRATPTNTPAPPTETPAPTLRPTLAHTRTPRPSPTDLPTLPVELIQQEQLAGVVAQHLAWSPDGAILAVANGKTLFYDAQTMEQVYTLEDANAGRIAFSADGALLAGASPSGVRLWQVDGWSLVRDLAGSQGTADLSFSPDGTFLATATGGTVKVWEVATGKEVYTTPLGTTVARVAFSPNDRYLVAVSNGVLHFLVPDTGEELSSMELGGWVNAIAFSPDGRYLAFSVTQDGTVGLLDLAQQAHLARILPGHDLPVQSLSFSPDGWLLAAGSGVQVKVWNLASVMLASTTLSGHSTEVECVAFSPDGVTLATGASDVRLWKVISQ